jgi:carbonic anhydrase/acetyltransferase-like protein (isoleucine patch superfamily)
MHIPAGSFVVGVPGFIKGSLSDEQKQWIKDAHLEYIELARKYKSAGL